MDFNIPGFPSTSCTNDMSLIIVALLISYPSNVEFFSSPFKYAIEVHPICKLSGAIIISVHLRTNLLSDVISSGYLIGSTFVFVISQLSKFGYVSIT